MPRNIRSHLNPCYKPSFALATLSILSVRFCFSDRRLSFSLFLSPPPFSLFSLSRILSLTLSQSFFHGSSFLSSNQLAITSQPLLCYLLPFASQASLRFDCAVSVTPRAKSCSNSSSSTIIRCYVS